MLPEFPRHLSVKHHGLFELGPALVCYGVGFGSAYCLFLNQPLPLELVEDFIRGHGSGHEPEPLLYLLPDYIRMHRLLSENLEYVNPQALLGIQVLKPFEGHGKSMGTVYKNS